MDETSGSVTFFSGATATLTWTPRRVLVSVAGDVDASFSPSGATIVRLLSGQERPVDVDLSRVRLFCAAGVGWLAALYAGVRSQVRVVAASDAVLEVLALCGVPTRSAGPRRRGTRHPALQAY